MPKYSAEEAQALYKEIVENTDIIGHATCGSASLEIGFRHVERTTAIAEDYMIEEFPCSDTEDGPPALRFHVASPWHALIHLAVNNRGWLEGKQGPLRTPLIYRGQRHSGWSLLPSILRDGTSRLEEEQRLSRFCRFARQGLSAKVLWGGCPDFGRTEALSDATLKATAQHYGIKTDLLDFTSDVAVAVWFACQEGRRGDTASVFALPFAMGAGGGVNVLFTHPLALRPYRQHGLFVEDPRNQLKRLLIEVRFPIDPDFQIGRDRLPTDLLPQDRWWGCVASATRQPEPQHPPPLNSSSADLKRAFEESLLHMLQTLMELSVFEVSRQPTFAWDVIAHIASRNGRMLKTCDRHLRSVGEDHFRGTMGQYVVPQMLDRVVPR